MSALSVPPSQKTNLSIGQGSIHNYTNTVSSPVSLAGVDHYSVVAYCTEVEVRASEADEGTMGSAEVQIQTDCYEEEMVAVNVDNAACEEVTSMQTVEMSETAGVAKALETLTKTFALRKENLGQDVHAGDSAQSPRSDELSPGNEPEERQTKLEMGNGTEVLRNFQPEAPETNTDLYTENCESITVEETPDVSSEVPGAPQPDVLRSNRLQMKPRCQEMWKITSAARECAQEPKTYSNILTGILYYHKCYSQPLFIY